jgi:hypothetical protein
MIIDATKINYFADPDRSAYDYVDQTKKSKKSTKSKKQETGVILDASSGQRKKIKWLFNFLVRRKVL